MVEIILVSVISLCNLINSHATINYTFLPQHPPSCLCDIILYLLSNLIEATYRLFLLSWEKDSSISWPSSYQGNMVSRIHHQRHIIS